MDSLLLFFDSLIQFMPIFVIIVFITSILVFIAICIKKRKFFRVSGSIFSFFMILLLICVARISCLKPYYDCKYDTSYNIESKLETILSTDKEGFLDYVENCGYDKSYGLDFTGRINHDGKNTLYSYYRLKDDYSDVEAYSYSYSSDKLSLYCSPIVYNPTSYIIVVDPSYYYQIIYISYEDIYICVLQTDYTSSISMDISEKFAKVIEDYEASRNGN